MAVEELVVPTTMKKMTMTKMTMTTALSLVDYEGVETEVHMVVQPSSLFLTRRVES